jgi:hypothetical protein
VTRPREEEIVRRLRNLVVVAALGFGCMAPVVTQAQVEPPGWGWGVLAERLLGWADGLWSAVAGSETEEPAEEDSDGETLIVDGEGETMAVDLGSTDSEAYPGYDPDG